MLSEEERGFLASEIHREITEAQLSLAVEAAKAKRGLWVAFGGVAVTLLLGLIGLTWEAGHVDQNVRDLREAASSLHGATDNVAKMVLVLDQRVKDDEAEIDRLERVLSTGVKP